MGKAFIHETFSHETFSHIFARKRLLCMAAVNLEKTNTHSGLRARSSLHKCLHKLQVGFALGSYFLGRKTVNSENKGFRFHAFGIAISPGRTELR